MFSNIIIGQSINLIEGKKFRGAIFPSSYKNTSYNWLEDKNRFTPTKEEILLFEKKLHDKLKLINKSRLNQKGKCPVIHNNLQKYIRQYLGFIDESGKKYLMINFLWSRSSLHENPKEEYYNELGDWKKNWQVWFDGCSHFWNVKYYLESETLFDLQVNGSS
ncbi:hypothetical protein HKT18_13555 [Flavobacterium sp. IMCC34852]|uniref:Uncharacterized protein n=1 Tax=Flavobacterium rivulicola TaxID=2732161 RepID=A0A7Y3VZW4_9FLAO|nr:hypothetical protein [Flavobacterium sp. IMCC34852]NNT73245.1 hypothetical protein [Flavobacterium sp. IMCC34852]